MSDLKEADSSDPHEIERFVDLIKGNERRNDEPIKPFGKHRAISKGIVGEKMHHNLLGPRNSVALHNREVSRHHHS